MMDHGKKNILGVLIDAVDYDAAVQRIIHAAKSRIRYTVTALAVHGVMTGVEDKKHRHRLNEFDLIVPDGQPVRWAINRLHGCGLPDRVYGPNLMLQVCEAAARDGLPIFLFGATQEILDRLEANLLAKFPSLKIAGKRPSQFKTLDDSAFQSLADSIVQSGAAITFAGIGCPRQEVWAWEMGDRLKMPILAVGAAFAFHAGKLSQAPKWMQDRGLEWLYRLLCEPTRLWKRYLLLNPAYLSLLALQRLGLKKFDPAQTERPATSVLYG
ncbi:MAG: WecB/TagA/CpsF family glycosyltransferase [Pirellulales bacterium]